MNKKELKAMLSVANKLGWNGKPADEVIETIKQMVVNQQNLELDTVGECSDKEAILLSMPNLSEDKLLSMRVVFDYESHIAWGIDIFCEDMGINYLDFRTMMDYSEKKADILAVEYEDYLEDYYSDYDAEIMRDVIWMNHNC